MRKRHHKKFSDATERIRAQHKDLAKRYVAVEKQLQKSSVSGNVFHPSPAYLSRVPSCVGELIVSNYVAVSINN